MQVSLSAADNASLGETRLNDAGLTLDWRTHTTKNARSIGEMLRAFVLTVLIETSRVMDASLGW